MEADALATALTLMGVEDGLAWSESHGVAAMFLVVENDNIVEKHSSYFDPYLQ
jgi:thiamine biosynthesis lipoprotein